jgi:hypothetical protein
VEAGWTHSARGPALDSPHEAVTNTQAAGNQGGAGCSSRRLVLEEAIDEYVARHDPEAVTDAMNRVVDAIDSRPDPTIATAARSIIECTEW